MQFGNARFDGRSDFRVQTLSEIFFGHADSEPAHGPNQVSFIIGYRDVSGSRVERIAAGDHAQENRGVFHGLGQRANVVERRRKGDQTVARHSPISRHESDYATERSRLADGAARVRAQGGNRGACGNGSG